jgi:integrase
LRHTFATRCARSGVGLVQAQHLLGHSDPKLTAKIYSHLEPNDLRAAMDEMERRMQKGRAKAQ